MGVIHAAVLIMGCIALATLGFWQPGTFLKRAERLALFLGILLGVGSVANGLWSCSIWGKLYYSTDYLFDFSPFWPITQKLIDAPFGDTRGRLLGISLSRLQFIWLLFAAATWIITIVLYRFIRKGRLAGRRVAGEVGTGLR